MRERCRAGLSAMAADHPRLSCIILDTAPHAAQGLATILKARLDFANRHLLLLCSSIDITDRGGSSVSYTHLTLPTIYSV